MKNFKPKKHEVNNEMSVDVESSEMITGLKQESSQNDNDNRQDSTVLSEATPLKTTIIEKGTVIDGDLKIKGNLELYGEVIGDVLCEAHVTLDGEIKGNVQCQSGTFKGGFITGNVSSKEDIQIGNKTEVFGDIESNSADVLGKVKGNCVLHSDIIIRESGAILGNIDAKDITIEKGATVQGSINIVREVFFELEA